MTTARTPAPNNTPPSQPRRPKKPVSTAGKKSWVPVVIFVALIALIIADYKSWLLPVQDILDQPEFSYSFGEYQLNLYTGVQYLIIGIIIAWAAYLIKNWCQKRVIRAKSIQNFAKPQIQKTVGIVIYFIAVLIFLNVIGIEFAPFGFVTLAAGIGLGFGIHKIVANFISGMFLLLDNSVKPGNVIELEDGTTGIIKQISARYTLLETFDAQALMVPNERILVDTVTTLHPNDVYSVPLDLSFFAPSGFDPDTVIQTAIAAASAHPAIDGQSPICHLKVFCSEGADYMMRLIVKDAGASRDTVKSDILRTLWRAFHSTN